MCCNVGRDCRVPNGLSGLYDQDPLVLIGTLALMSSDASVCGGTLIGSLGRGGCYFFVIIPSLQGTSGSLPNRFTGALQLFKFFFHGFVPGAPCCSNFCNRPATGAPASQVWPIVVLTLIPINSLGGPGSLSLFLWTLPSLEKGSLCVSLSCLWHLTK